MDAPFQLMDVLFQLMDNPFQLTDGIFYDLREGFAKKFSSTRTRHAAVILTKEDTRKHVQVPTDMEMI